MYSAIVFLTGVKCPQKHDMSKTHNIMS